MVEEVLQDDPHRRVVRVGDTVRRPVQPWSPAIHALLLHLEEVGFGYAPRFLGIDEHGREMLTFVEGESGPQSWAKVVDDGGLARFAELLREYHDAVTGFELPPSVAWSTDTDTSGIDGAEVVCHGDFGPWNVVWQGADPVGVIDWDFAHWGTRSYDVAYALEYVAPFRDDAECLRWLRYPEPPDRRHRIEVFAAAYGLDSTDGLVDAVIEVQRDMIERVRRLAAAGQQPQVDWVAAGHLDELLARVAWSEGNRQLVEGAP
ncbi:aminoglycoside phosphotransferase family protein [Jiangella asiatica]|uniref:Aminoglycoside phosphotransferase family protein n=1 Tax=Jiangella asiatica TaxID=2530372 RepID=A0A4R5DV67_9ACTN|nr:aminoglycoside phosphotransferase family protein [Jiangella asiatica]TDE16051.1 aminoglycoside phosphotransferase family protein [Jiangella asiatica]